MCISYALCPLQRTMVKILQPRAADNFPECHLELESLKTAILLQVISSNCALWRTEDVMTHIGLVMSIDGIEIRLVFLNTDANSVLTGLCLSLNYVLRGGGQMER